MDADRDVNTAVVVVAAAVDATVTKNRGDFSGIYFSGVRTAGPRFRFKMRPRTLVKRSG